MSTGKNIKTLRNRLGMTQVQFANELKVTQGNVSLWETDVKNPSVPVSYKIIKLAKSKGVIVSLEYIRPEEE